MSIGDSQPEEQRHPFDILGHLKAKCRSRRGIGQLLIYLSLIGITAGGMGLNDAAYLADKQKKDEQAAAEKAAVTPPELRMGWDEVAAAQEAPALAARTPKFRITDKDGNILDAAGKFVELYKYTKMANGGKHLTPWRQETGDCCSMGETIAVQTVQGVQIARDGKPEELKLLFPPYNYGTGRVQVGKHQIRGQGSTGAHSAQAAMLWGSYPIEEADRQGFKYSGRLADQWGNTGPPKIATDYAQKFRIETVSQVRSWEDVRDAIGNGYPVTVASNVGFDGDGYYERDGKLWLRPRGNWGHQMCFTAMEDRPGKQKGCFCQNSWGAEAHRKPLGDEPFGGFWVDSQTVQRMVSAGDSWAYSQFAGFPAKEMAWDIFSQETIELAESTGNLDLKDAVVAAEAPQAEEPEPPKELWEETRKMSALPISYGILLLSIGAMATGLVLMYGRNKRFQQAVAVLLCVGGMIGTSLTAEAGRGRCVNGQCFGPSYSAPQYTPTALATQPLARPAVPVVKPTASQTVVVKDCYEQDVWGKIWRVSPSGERVHLVVVDAEETVKPQRTICEYISVGDLRKIPEAKEISIIKAQACRCGSNCKCAAEKSATAAAKVDEKKPVPDSSWKIIDESTKPHEQHLAANKSAHDAAVEAVETFESVMASVGLRAPAHHDMTGFQAMPVEPESTGWNAIKLD